MKSVIPNKAPAAPPAAAAPAYAPPSKDEIKKLQLDLERLGQTTGNNNHKQFQKNPNIRAESMDGIRGPLTDAAINRFKEANPDLKDRPDTEVFGAIHKKVDDLTNAIKKAAKPAADVGLSGGNQSQAPETASSVPNIKEAGQAAGRTMG